MGTTSIRNALVVIWCGGFSSSPNSLEPIWKVPAGISTISEPSFSQRYCSHPFAFVPAATKPGGITALLTFLVGGGGGGGGGAGGSGSGGGASAAGASATGGGATRACTSVHGGGAGGAADPLP